MNKKIRTLGLAALLVLWAVLAACLWLGAKEEYTYAERRPLSQMPRISANVLFSGEFAEDFEEFALDQFPLRDSFRRVKALFHYYVLNQKDNNGIYLAEDTVAKLEYPLNETSVRYALGRLQHLYESYLQNTECKVYAALIPDKGCYLAEENGYPAMDYAAMANAYRDAMPWAEGIDLFDVLSAQDYYRTDTHWRQERLLQAADRICTALGTASPKPEDYTQTKLEVPFYGVYFGQAALPLEPDEMVVLQSDLLDNCTVTDPVTGKQTKVYDMDKLTSPDLYDVFLSGAQPVLIIENPQGNPDKELILFRDSYGSSLTPLLVQDYNRVTLVDIRYIHPDQIGEYVAFDGQDVLFLYSTLILNNGRSLK